MIDYPSPLCMFCQHLSEVGLTCTAFPIGIPDDILHSDFDHRNPHAGDHGIQFEMKDSGQAELIEELFQDIFP